MHFSLRKPYYQNFWQDFLASQPSLMQEVLEKCYCNISEEDDDLIGYDNKKLLNEMVSFEVSTYYKNSKREMVLHRMSKSKKTKK